MAYRYKGEFATQDETANTVFYIFPASYTATRNLSLGTDPVTITWEEVPITGGIQGSQAEIDFVIKEDGFLEDIIESNEKWYCEIYYAGSSNVYWRGCLASRSWEEPFSRLNGYQVSLTFSDFGYLKRCYYDETAAVHAGAVSNGLCTVRDIIAYALSLLQNGGTLSNARMYLDDSDGTGGYYYGLNGQVFFDLYIDTATFYKNDEPLDYYTIIKNVIEPAGKILTQRTGLFSLFNPDTVNYNGEIIDYRYITAAGTDAIRSSADYYKKFTLTYDQAEKESIDSYNASEDEIDYLGPWEKNRVYGYEDSDTVARIWQFGDPLSESYDGLCASVIDGDGNATPVILYSYGNFDNAINVPTGQTAPVFRTHGTWYNPIITTSLNGYRFDNTEYPDSSTGHLTFEFKLFIDRRAIETLATDFETIPIRAKFTAKTDGTVRYLAIGPMWQSTSPTTANCLKAGIQNVDSIDFDKRYYELTFKTRFPAPYVPANLEIYADFDTWLSDYDNEGINIGLESVSLKLESYRNKIAMDSENKATATGVRVDGDEYSASFVYGTPSLLTPATQTAYMPNKTPYAVSVGSRFIDRLCAFTQRNYGRLRWRYNGTYRFNHDEFDAPLLDQLSECVPFHLRYSDGRPCYLYCVSEKWHMRSNKSECIWEEVWYEYGS